MKKKIFPLSEPIASAFAQACRAFPVSALPDLRRRVDLACARLQERAEEDDLGPDTDLVRNICSELAYLIDNHRLFGPQQQQLIVGAVSYFLLVEDAIHDHTPITGLDDDARLLNHVLEELGLERRFLEL